MARTFDLGCDHCCVCLWVGQRPTAGEFYLYTRADHTAALRDFLLAHEGHPLRFLDTEQRPLAWRELGDRDAEEHPSEIEPDWTTLASAFSEFEAEVDINSPPSAPLAISHRYRPRRFTGMVEAAWRPGLPPSSGKVS